MLPLRYYLFIIIIIVISINIISTNVIINIIIVSLLLRDFTVIINFNYYKINSL